jgi:NDP-sugar pyrophosphorylase family protein
MSMKPTLLILAAGIGSRYGGLKQVDGMGPGGEAILEFSISDALRAGFGKVVFIIRRDIEDAFREAVGRKIEPHADVYYAYQEMYTALGWIDQIPERAKPWGTAHAMLAAREYLTEPFAVINADDYYGSAAYQTIGDFLRTECSPTLYGMVAYRLGNTLSDNGSVSRGVCTVDDQGFVTSIIERTKIEKFEEGIIFVEDGQRNALTPETPVSMNLFGFHPSVLDHTDEQFREFVLANRDNSKAEFFIPLVVNRLIQEGKIRMRALYSEAQWFGVTYPEDKGIVQGALRDLVGQGAYSQPLWPQQAV